LEGRAAYTEPDSCIRDHTSVTMREFRESNAAAVLPLVWRAGPAGGEAPLIFRYRRFW